MSRSWALLNVANMVAYAKISEDGYAIFMQLHRVRFTLLTVGFWSSIGRYFSFNFYWSGRGNGFYKLIEIRRKGRIWVLNKRGFRFYVKKYSTNGKG